MAHFAELDGNDFVLRTIVVLDEDALTEAAGIAYCKSVLGEDTIWLQTSRSGRIRANFAGAGYFYRRDLDMFIAPQPTPAHELDEGTGQWKPPSPGEGWTWDGWRWNEPSGDPPT